MLRPNAEATFLNCLGWKSSTVKNESSPTPAADLKNAVFASLKLHTGSAYLCLT